MTEPTEWVMVPREPTPEMISAGGYALKNYLAALSQEDRNQRHPNHPIAENVWGRQFERSHKAQIRWAAMLSAVPTPPSSPPLDVVREWEEAAFQQSVQAMKREGDRMAAALTAENSRATRLGLACSELNAEISQTLGLALGYPKYADDQKNFPDATGDDVCVGDNVAECLATEAATKITAQAKRIEGLEKLDAEHISARASQNRVIGEECEKRRAAEATVTELRAEVAKLQEPGGLTVNCLRLGTCSEKTRLEAEVERLTGMKLELCKLIGQVRDERDTARAALAKIDAIRNDIIARQTINWSAHIYPLVAALGDAGYEGVDYETARAAIPQEGKRK